jgi:DNA-binding MarR family transcriptional regulator
MCPVAPEPPYQDSVGAEIGAWIDQMPEGVDPRVEAARQRLGRISRQFERILAHAAAQHQLTVGDWQALSVLQRSGAPYACTPKQLADTLGVTSGTISVRIDRLIRAGLVEPVAADDGRSRPIRLTRKGHRRWSAATKDRTTYEREIFTGALSDDQLAKLNPLLSSLLAGLEGEFGPVSRHDTSRSER